MRDATKQVRDELTKRGVIWGKPAPEYWELLGGMPTRDYVTTVGDVNICETTAGKLVVENLTPEQAIAAVLGPGKCNVDVLNTGDCAGYECSEYIMHCNGCGHEFGHVLYNEDGDVWMSEVPNFCPNCGAKVEDE